MVQQWQQDPKRVGASGLEYTSDRNHGTRQPNHAFELIAAPSIIFLEREIAEPLGELLIGESFQVRIRHFMIPNFRRTSFPNSSRSSKDFPLRYSRGVLPPSPSFGV